MDVIRWSTWLVVLVTLSLLVFPSSAFHHMHKIMAAALLANSLQRNSFIPLPIPIPIPIKVGGNTIIAMPNGEGGVTYLQGGGHNSKGRYW